MMSLISPRKSCGADRPVSRNALTSRKIHGEPWAALSLAGPTTRITAARVPTLGDLVRETASAMTAALGGQSPRQARRTNEPAAKV